MTFTADWFHSYKIKIKINFVMLYHAPNNLTQYKCRCTDLLMWNTFFTFLFITKKKKLNKQPTTRSFPVAVPHILWSQTSQMFWAGTQLQFFFAKRPATKLSNGTQSQYSLYRVRRLIFHAEHIRDFTKSVSINVALFRIV